MKPKFTLKRFSISLVFTGCSIAAQLSLALHWPEWTTWALIPFVVISGFLVVLPYIRQSQEQDEKVRSGLISEGSKFSRTIPINDEIFKIIENWANGHVYKIHPLSTESKTVYMRTPFSLMPIFVSVEKNGALLILEAWCGREAGCQALTSEFSLSIPNKIGRGDVNKLLEMLKQPLI